MFPNTILVLVLFLILQGLSNITVQAEPIPSSTTPGVSSREQTNGTLEFSEGATTIQLDRAVHFTTPQGTDLVVAAGMYEVKSTSAATLQLTSERETPLLIAAAQSPHTYQVEQTQPIAVALPGEDEESLHIMLTQVDGESLEAAGSYSGVQTRGANKFVSPSRAHLWLQSKAYTSSLPSKSTASVDLRLHPPIVNVPVTIVSGTGVTLYQECEGMSGYVSSITTMLMMAQASQDQPMPANWDTRRPPIVLVDSGAAPAQPRPGGPTYPNTSFRRLIPKNPYRCTLGSITVSSPKLTVGRTVRLTMTVHDLTLGRVMLIADTYQLPVTTPGSVTFGKVVVTSISLASVPPSNQSSYVNLVVDKRAPNGALVKIEAFIDGISSVTRDCLYKPTKHAYGAGTLTCS